jgi:hypothetical protein
MKCLLISAVGKNILQTFHVLKLLSIHSNVSVMLFLKLSAYTALLETNIQGVMQNLNCYGFSGYSNGNKRVFIKMPTVESTKHVLNVA